MNKQEDQPQNDADELTEVPNPPVEELSEDELNNVAGGAGKIAQKVYDDAPTESHNGIISGKIEFNPFQ